MSNVVEAKNPVGVIKNTEQYEEKVLIDALFLDSSNMKLASTLIMKHLDK